MQTRDVNELMILLGEMGFLPAFNCEETSILCRSFEKIHYDEGDVVIRQGNSAGAFYIVSSGRLKVIHFTEDGRQIYLDEMVPGDYFGETGLLCEGVRTSSIVAEEATKVFMLGRDAFLSVLYSKPAVSEKIRLMIRKRQEKNQAMMHIALGRKNVPEGKKENPLNRIIGKK